MVPISAQVEIYRIDKYNRALSQGQINEMYQKGPPAKGPPAKAQQPNPRAFETPAVEVLDALFQGHRALGLHMAGVMADVEMAKSYHEELEQTVKFLEYQIQELEKRLNDLERRVDKVRG